MAQDRIYIRCKVCGKAFYLGKTFWDERGFFLDNPRKASERGRKLYQFFRNHAGCFWHGEDNMQYDIIYESEVSGEIDEEL